MLFQSAPFICDISPASVFYPAPIKIPHGVVEIEHTALFTVTSSPLHSILLKNLFIFYFEIMNNQLNNLIWLRAPGYDWISRVQLNTVIGRTTAPKIYCCNGAMFQNVKTWCRNYP